MEPDDIDRQADALIHTSVEDARTSMQCGTSRIIIERALVRMSGMDGQITRRRMFDAYLRKTRKQEKKP